MKKFLFLFFALCSSYSFGQNGNFNTLRVYYGAVFGSQLRDPSAMVDIQGTTGGFLCPRLTTTERNAIPSPATGLMIYNTSTGAFNWYNGSGWSVVGTGGGTVTSVSGTANRITSTGGATPVIDISASYVGQSSITTLGTVTTGTWNGSVLGVAYGGTNISSYAIGDIIYASGATTLSKLPIGTANQQLRVNAGATALEYFTPASSGITVGTTTITSGTSLRIPYNLAGVYQEQANFSIGSVAAGYLDVPSGYAQGGSFVMRQSANSLWLGSATGRTTVAQTNSTIIGVGAHPQNGGAGYNTCVGYNSNASASGGGYSNSVVGTNSLSNATIGSINNGIGVSCLTGITTGNQNISVGSNTFAVNVSYSASFGNGSSPTADNEIVWGSTNYPGEYTSRYTAMYVGSGKTSASPAAFSIFATGGLGTNIAGGNITIAGGSGTGTAAGGNNVEQTSVKLASGTTLQPLTDRHNIVGKYVDITAGSAQTFGNLALATSSTVSGGTVIYTIEANDATDYQSLSGVLKYDVVNKAGTLTVAFEDDQNSACACSAGTLTATVTAAVSGTNLLFQSDAVSSLSETTLRVSFQVLNNFGQAVITPN